uniref:Uncharacterized protein n=1 Tax=Aegilops tauschii subsp. strangulata TaxID=200361 RepID=A0A453L0T8_AEGTS
CSCRSGDPPFPPAELNFHFDSRLPRFQGVVVESSCRCSYLFSFGTSSRKRCLYIIRESKKE